MIAIGDQEFSLFQKLIEDRAGIFLSPAKKALLEARLSKRIKELGLASFSAYHNYLLEDRGGRSFMIGRPRRAPVFGRGKFAPGAPVVPPGRSPIRWR